MSGDYSVKSNQPQPLFGSQTIVLKSVNKTPSPHPPDSDLQHQDQKSLSNQGKALPSISMEDRIINADLNLNIEDKNGINQVAQGDLSGSLNGSIKIERSAFSEHITNLKGMTTKDGHKSSEIKDAYFDSDELAYVLKIEADAVWGAFWDNFEAKIKTNQAGELYVALEDNWFPDNKILNSLKDSLNEMFQSKLKGQLEQLDVELEIEKRNDRLYLKPVVKQIEIPLGQKGKMALEDIGAVGKFEIDESGSLNIKFDNVTFNGSSNANASPAVDGTKDSAQIHLSAQVNKQGEVQAHARGQVNISLDKQEAEGINFGGHNLAERVQGLKLNGHINANFGLKNGEILVASQNQWHFEDVQIEGNTYQINSRDLQVSVDNQAGINIAIQDQKPLNTYRPQMSQNIVDMHINGDRYFEEMMNNIQTARESIELETFLYSSDDKTTTDLTRLLALKAAGLQEGKEGLEVDSHAPQGVSVHVLFNNWKLSKAGGKATEELFQNTLNQLKHDISNLNLPSDKKLALTEQLEQNLNWHAFAEGIAKTDHRKVLVIDGQKGFTGGINLGDSYLSQDSYHDMMLEVDGPAVNQMQAEFIANWADFSGQKKTNWNSKSILELEQHVSRLEQHGNTTSALDVITTDDQSTDIEQAMLMMINQAENEIQIEHVFFYHQPIIDALKQALERGVTLNIITPQRNNIEFFDLVNTGSVVELMETQQKLGKGKVNAFLYTGRPGEKSHMAHTKAMSADGKTAIVGSANILSRSLRSSFFEEFEDGQKHQILFNEELSLYIEDPAKVQELNQKLFLEDQSHFTQPMTLEQLKQRIEKLGGQNALLQAQLKARLS